MKKETIEKLKALSPNPIKKRLIVNAYADVLELSLYGDIQPDYYDPDKDQVIESETSAAAFKKILDKYDFVPEIRLSINSLGGYVSEGIAIYTLLKRHKAKKSVFIDGFACSMASLIAMAGDTVTMGSSSMMMIHNPWTVVRGNASELRKAADDLEAMNDSFRRPYLDKANGKLTENTLIRLLDNETFLDAKECSRYGFCDVVETAKGQVSANVFAHTQTPTSNGKKVKKDTGNKQESQGKGWLFDPEARKGWFF